MSLGEIYYRFCVYARLLFCFLLLTFWGHSNLVGLIIKVQLHPGEIVFCGQL